jgi:hypothetical protein
LAKKSDAVVDRVSKTDELRIDFDLGLGFADGKRLCPEASRSAL